MPILNRAYRIPLANVVLEAAATGIAVVTTLATGSRDAAVPEVTGLLIPPGYTEAISEAVLKLIRNPAMRRRMGNAARAWVIEHYSNERVLGLMTAFYPGLLEPALPAVQSRRSTGLAAVPH